MSGRLPTGLWVTAHVARCSSQGTPVVVVRRGDPHRGVVIVKQHRIGEGFRVVTQARDLDGRLMWQSLRDGALLPEAEADAGADALSSYSFNAEGAEEGVWFPWPKLGPKARLRIGYAGSERYSALQKKARRKFGKTQKDGSVRIPDDVLPRILPALFAQGLCLGLEEVKLGPCRDTSNYKLERDGTARGLLLDRVQPLRLGV